MALLSPSTPVVVNPTIARLHRLIWVLIYGGLLTLVLGLMVQRTEPDTGWLMAGGGAAAAALGLVLIFVRARMRV